MNTHHFNRDRFLSLFEKVAESVVDHPYFTGSSARGLSFLFSELGLSDTTRELINLSVVKASRRHWVKPIHILIHKKKVHIAIRNLSVRGRYLRTMDFSDTRG